VLAVASSARRACAPIAGCIARRPELNRLVEAAENDSAFTLALAIESRAQRLGAARAWPRFAQGRDHAERPRGRAGTGALADASKWLRSAPRPPTPCACPAVGIGD
jgi:hypothetical protein